MTFSSAVSVPTLHTPLFGPIYHRHACMRLQRYPPSPRVRCRASAACFTYILLTALSHPRKAAKLCWLIEISRRVIEMWSTQVSSQSLTVTSHGVSQDLVPSPELLHRRLNVKLTKLRAPRRGDHPKGRCGAHFDRARGRARSFGAAAPAPMEATGHAQHEDEDEACNRDRRGGIGLDDGFQAEPG